MQETSASDAAVIRLIDEASRRGAFTAASAIVAVDGAVVLEHHVGTTRAWDAPGVPARRPGPAVTASTRFDLASITKPLVAAALLAELHARSLDVDLPVAQVLPEFADDAGSRHRDLTLGRLLDHTAGFPAEWLDRAPDPGGIRFRRDARPDAPPGSLHRYSCVGYIWAGFALEAIAQAPLAEVVRARVLDPLGMADTGYRPGAGLRTSIAATESQPGRGMVQGEVHDETAWALGGVSGNAGLFGTARDLLRFAEALRTGGLLGGERVLPEPVVAALTSPRPLPGSSEGDGEPEEPAYRQALGPRLDDEWMRGLGRTTAGHSGFTGTAFVTEPGGRRSIVFLTNRVHPTRSSTELLALRGRVIDAAARLGEQP
ncbi:serine hydrolase [Agromyces sp. CFH 90414]|uniref:Serine hydrolase n=1 Tax=Agromyces agglutinans TaxID=2662258 RepID=A0A6I2F6Q3_9MICO|nr:serine hydrolase domain-containing protein [Agromyces agglutinans]MRG60001.1 serine hydrolase [Agromyces agglutinans]